jgi:Iron-containing redox enzyme
LPPHPTGKKQDTVIGVERTAGSDTDRTVLPAVGPISELVRGLLASPGEMAATLPPAAAAAVEGLLGDIEDPLADDDLQLALYLCFELHYRSFASVDDEWEWSPALLAIRAALERSFLDALNSSLSSSFVSHTGTKGELSEIGAEEVGDALFGIEAEDEGPSLSRYIERKASLEQFREFVVHRSLYQLKEADPHSWAIPRIAGAAKTALLEVQGDEYGSGQAERMHSALFAKTMRALELDDGENAYLQQIPGATLATVNLMSALGLRRSRRGGIVGHLAMFEMTSAGPNRRYGNALRRLGFDAEATDFYDEHVEADAVHENIAAYDLAGGLAKAEPELTEDIVFGARALLHLEARFAAHLLDAWEAGETSLRRPL